MLDIDLSMLNKGLLAESWYVALGDYIIDLGWSPDASKLAAVTVEGLVFLIDNHGESAYFKLLGQHAGGANACRGPLTEVSLRRLAMTVW